MGKHPDLEFKMQTAQLVVEQGRKPAQVAEDLDIPIGTLKNWIRAYKDKKENGFVGSGNMPPEIKSLKDLKKQIKDLQEENELLKKAMHIFTKDPK
jgi:transposase